MSSGNSYPRCAIDIRASRCLYLYSFVLISAAALAPWFVNIPVGFALLLNVAVLPAAFVQFHWARGELSRVAWQSDGRWMLVDRNGREHEEAHLLPGVFIGSRLLALRWRCVSCQRKFRVALLADNCDANAFRRLAVRLRLTPDAELFEKP